MNVPPNGRERGDLVDACGTPHETITRHSDGELRGEALRGFEAHLATCVECQREVAGLRAMKGDLRSMSADKIRPPGGSVWDAVNRRLTRPTGWIMLVAGAVLYAAYAAYTFIQSPMNLGARLANGLFVIGLLVLLVSVAIERIRDYRTDPYKGVER